MSAGFHGIGIAISWEFDWNLDKNWELRRATLEPHPFYSVPFRRVYLRRVIEASRFYASFVSIILHLFDRAITTNFPVLFVR